MASGWLLISYISYFLYSQSQYRRILLTEIIRMEMIQNYIIWNEIFLTEIIQNELIPTKDSSTDLVQSG